MVLHKLCTVIGVSLLALNAVGEGSDPFDSAAADDDEVTLLSLKMSVHSRTKLSRDMGDPLDDMSCDELRVAAPELIFEFEFENLEQGEELPNHDFDGMSCDELKDLAKQATRDLLEEASFETNPALLKVAATNFSAVSLVDPSDCYNCAPDCGTDGGWRNLYSYSIRQLHWCETRMGMWCAQLCSQLMPSCYDGVDRDFACDFCFMDHSHLGEEDCEQLANRQRRRRERRSRKAREREERER